MPPIDEQEKVVERDEPQLDLDEEEGDVEARRAAELVNRSETVRRAYGADKGTPKIDLVDF